MQPKTSHRKQPVFLLILILLLLIPASSATIIYPTTTTTPSPTFKLAPINTIHTFVPVTTEVPAGPQTGYISLSSTPSGADVTIDGAMLGTTPFTSRMLTTGSHRLLLHLDGYQDISTTFVIQPDTMNTETYRLIPLTTIIPGTPVTQEIRVTPVTVLTPSVTRVPVTTPSVTRVPVQQAGGTSLAAELGKIGPVTVNPIVIRVGNHTKSPILTTLSPWFQAQFDSSTATGTAQWFSPPVFKLPVNYIEVDQYNVYLKGSHLMSNVEMAVDPVWGDEDTVYISTDAKFYNNTNFRWITLEPDATALYQVSQYPFDANASLWQNQYVPGLVASGPVKDVYVDKEGFHYFSLNFAQIANHDPANPPYYTGTSNLDPTVPGQGRPMALAKIPYTSSGIWYKQARLGPVTLPVPNSLATIPSGELVESDLGNPNENMILSNADALAFHAPTPFMTSFMDLDRTFYVRVVPVSKNGTVGIATLPVTVTVKRPHPCPADTPSTVESTILVKPPSAEIKSFYMNLIVPDWIRTDQNGALVSRAHFVTVTTPPYCAAPATGNSMIDSSNAQFCSMYGGSQPNYHFYADPAESHWYDTVWDIIKGMFSALSSVVNSVSAAWNQINNLVVQIAAYAIQGLTLGAFDCNSSPACTGVLHAALSAAESALGIPPTIPNFSDLQSMGADYLAKVAADQIGAGGALDAAQSAYGAMPDSAKQAIKDNAGEVGESLGDAVSTQSGAQMASAAGSFYIPDPLYYKPHPAMAFVRVYNPNNVATDQISLTVSDSAGFFKKAEVIVPPLKPLDSTVVPVILVEDYSRVYTTGCDNKAWTMTNGIPCYWENWNQAARKWGTDKLVIGMSVKKNGQWINQLTPYSSGIVLSSQNVFNIDDEGKTCPGYTAKTILKYPGGWQMTQTGWSQDLNSVMWNAYTFTNGASGHLIGA